MRHPLILALVLALHPGSAEPQPEPLAAVEASDPATPALREWRQGLEEGCRKDGLIVPAISAWSVLSHDSLKALFPQHRFHAISWSEQPAPGREKEAAGLALGLATTLVSDAEGKIIKEVPHTGNYEAFGELLHDEKVMIRTREDAGRVWSAFCDIHRKRWQQRSVIQIDDRRWHLGDVTINGFRYYYEVLLDENARVVAAKLHADKIEPDDDRGGAQQPPDRAGDP